MVIREAEYRADIVRAPGKNQGYFYHVYRGEGTQKLAHGCEHNANDAAVKANAAISELVRQDLECERLSREAG